MRKAKKNRKFQEPPLGENKEEQWYKNDPKRLREEIVSMADEYPEFKQGFDENGNVFWKGIVVLTKVKSSLTFIPRYQNFKVRIICKSSYPLSFPLIEDLGKVLIGKCPHIYQSVNAICYSFGIGSELDFEHKHKIKDLYGVIQQFLVKQSVFEETDIWPDAQFHGVNAFIMAEFENGCLDPKSLCLCRMEGKLYGDCHLLVVDEQIAKINSLLRTKYGKVKLGRNSKCPCGSGIKFKKCCLWKDYFGTKRMNFITLYPQLTKEILTKILSKLDSEINKKLIKTSVRQTDFQQE